MAVLKVFDKEGNEHLFPGSGGVGTGTNFVTAQANLTAGVVPVGDDGAKGIKDSTGVAIVAGTGALQVPSGTTAQRPTAVDGRYRYNTDTPGFEGVTASAWGAIGGGGSSVEGRFLSVNSPTEFAL